MFLPSEAAASYFNENGDESSFGFCVLLSSAVPAEEYLSAFVLNFGCIIF